jgi:hypothetical protein
VGPALAGREVRADYAVMRLFMVLDDDVGSRPDLA